MLADPEGYRRGYNLPLGSTPQTAAELAKTRKQILLSLYRVGMGRSLGRAESWGTLDTQLSAFTALVGGGSVERPGSMIAAEGRRLTWGTCLGSWGRKRLENTSFASLLILF